MLCCPRNRIQRTSPQTSKHQMRCSCLTTTVKRTTATTPTRHFPVCFRYSGRWYSTSLLQTLPSFGIKHQALAESPPQLSATSPSLVAKLFGNRQLEAKTWFAPEPLVVSCSTPQFSHHLLHSFHKSVTVKTYLSSEFLPLYHQLTKDLT